MHTILIVDNEPLEATSLQQMLDGEGYDFVTAATAADARTVIDARGHELAAILIDWILPDVDGVEFLAWIKGRPTITDVEVVVHSAEFDPAYVRAGIECGAYYYLTKPFDEPQLEAIIRAAVSSFRLKRNLKKKTRETEDACQMLEVGTFRFSSVEEAELLAVHLGSACNRVEATLGLRELLVNAVEHGNLSIAYEEKSRLVAEGTIVSERARRLSLPEYCDRRVAVSLRTTGSVIELEIEDEGTGFDFERFLTLDRERLFDLHGRGVLIAATALDLEYLPPGNRVRVRLPRGDSLTS